MNAAELRDLTDTELMTQLEKLQKEYFNLRMQRAAGTLGQTHLVPKVKRDIARARTVMRKREMQHG